MNRKCIFCSEDLSDRGAFCKACGKQSACRDCQSILEIDSRFCVVCGTDVHTESSSKSGNGDSVSKSPVNIFEFTETKSSRTAKATLTDQSVANLQETLSLVVSGYPLGTIPQRIRHPANETNGQQGLFPPDDAFGDDETIIDVSPRTLPAVGNNTLDDIKSLFYLDNEKLLLEVKDLKAKGLKDFGVRLAYLRMLYAKEVDKQEFLRREDLNATIREVMGTLDPNIVNWISTTNDFSIKEENGEALVRLRGDGRKKALETLAEVLDDGKQGSYTLDKKGKAPSRSGNKSDSAATQTKSGSPKQQNKDIDTWIERWNSLKLDVDLQGIAKTASQVDRVVMAVALIYKVTNGETDAAKTTKIAPLLKDLFFVPVARQNLDKALRKGTNDLLIRTTSGWRVTPEGLKRSKELLGDKFAGGKK